MADSDYKYLILGASWKACGLASRLKNALILERGSVPGPEYSLALNPGREWLCMPGTDDGRSLREELIARKALYPDGGAANPVAFTPLLARWCLQHDVKILLGMDVFEVTAHQVRGVGRQGIRSWTAEQIIDLRKDASWQFSLNGLVRYADASIQAVPFTVLPNTLANSVILSLPLPDRCTPDAARARWIEHWMNVHRLNPDARLICTASRFADGNTVNPISDLEAGVSEAEKLC